MTAIKINIGRHIPSLYSPVARVLSWLLMLECLMLLIPMATSLACGEHDWPGFAIAAALSGVVGAFGTILFRASATKLNRRDAFMLISFVWILFSVVSMIPFVMAAAPLSPADAFFESISGFTTTGATTIADVEAQSHGILLWRAMTQWIGGLGIVLFLIALLPALNDTGGIMMFNAEITGMTHDKLHPRIKQTAMSLWTLYLSLTVLLAILLVTEGMSLFDSICQAMATLSTGGFSTRNGSIASWDSPGIAATIGIFMLLGGMNFMLLYNALHGHLRRMWHNDVLRIYLGVVASFAAVTGITIYLSGLGDGFAQTVVAPFFHIVSAITSTGFSYADYALWGALPLLLTMIVMATGACAGSTTGAIKLDRIAAVFKNLKREITLTVFPHRVEKFSVGGRNVTDCMMLRVAGFLTLYALIFVAGCVAMSAFGYPLLDSAFASLSCIGNNGL